MSPRHPADPALGARRSRRLKAHLPIIVAEDISPEREMVEEERDVCTVFPMLGERRSKRSREQPAFGKACRKCAVVDRIATVFTIEAGFIVDSSCGELWGCGGLFLVGLNGLCRQMPMVSFS